MKKFSLLWLSLPIFVFVGLVTFFITRLPHSQTTSTTNQPTPSPVSANPSPLPVSSTNLQILVAQIKSFSVNDPNLELPTFDRHLEIPGD